MTEVVAYRYRPAKQIVRSMMVEMLGRLRPIAPLSDYIYVGFGGREFLDFELFHRRLDFPTMVSIEKNTSDLGRYEFNRPFSCVQVVPGVSSDVLPQLDFARLSVVWLDYECHLTSDVIADLEDQAYRMCPGSVLVVTVSAHADHGGERRSRLEARLGADRVPPGISEADLGGWKLAGVQYDIMTEEVAVAASRRTDGASLQQLLNFRYQDNAKMQTVGWIVSSPALAQLIENNCRFHNLEFFRSAADALTISVPTLTRKEFEFVRDRLPAADVASLGADWLPRGEREGLMQFYRWYSVDI